MLVIQNRKIKKGIEIPELEIVFDDGIMILPACDKIKYADFLALNPMFYGLSEIDGLIGEQYTGDEIILSPSVLTAFLTFQYYVS